MRQITIGFSKASTRFPIFSWLIMLIQKTPYSHVYLKYDNKFTGMTMYYQASHTLVNSMCENVFLSQEEIIKEFTFNVSDDAFKTWIMFADQNAGKPYGIKEILGLFLVELALLIGLKIDNPFKEAGETWICDQLIAAGLQQCNNIKLLIPLNNMTPKDMYELVSSLPKDLN